MTACEFADLVHARRTGRGRWQAKCPSHPDRRPSLSIRQGERGILLRCWSAGCTAEQVCAALGIRVADLFDGPPATPEQLAILNAERKAKAAQERRERAVGRAQRDRVWKLQQLADSLGANLVLRPNDIALGKLFHDVCTQLHDAAPYHALQDGPTRSEPTPEIPSWIVAALSEIGQNFNEVTARMRND